MATKIVNKLPNRRAVPFKDVKKGSFFLDSDDDLCIRVGGTLDSNNAFYFNGDCFIDMSSEEKVIPVNVTISIDGYGA